MCPKRCSFLSHVLLSCFRPEPQEQVPPLSCPRTTLLQRFRSSSGECVPLARSTRGPADSASFAMSSADAPDRYIAVGAE